MKHIGNSHVGEDGNSGASDGKTIRLIAPRGFCAGVRRAVEMAETALRLWPPPIFCLRELVHNIQVTRDLERRGVRFIDDPERAPRGAVLLFGAHGVTPEIRRAARRRGLRLLDATCPYVVRLHGAVRRYAREGRRILLIGDGRHDEVIGVRAEAPDHVTVIADIAAARAVSVPDPGKVAVLAQTTLDSEKVRDILAVLRERFPDLTTPGSSGICLATGNRQRAARMATRGADMAIVLGSVHSSNTNRLVEICRRECGKALRVSVPEDLDAVDWNAVGTLALTAGASTPDTFIDEIVARLRARGFTRTIEEMVAEENDKFKAPRLPAGDPAVCGQRMQSGRRMRSAGRSANS